MKNKKIIAYNCLVYTARDIKNICKKRLELILLYFSSFTQTIKKNNETKKNIKAVICELAQIAPDLKDGSKNITKEKRYNKFLFILSNFVFRHK